LKPLRFDDRVAVITGAGRGLGRAHALLLASRGARLVVDDTGGSLKGEGVDTGPAEDVAREIRARGGDAVSCSASVATPEGARAIVETALERYGRLDVLIHNAGIVRAAPLKEMTQADFDAVLDVHLRGAFQLVRAAFARMCEARYGRIVLTSSIGGIYGNHRQANYGAAKAGLIGLCNVVALEGAAEGVKCNVIVPGAVTRMAEGLDTRAFPPMSPEMVAPVVAWLAHEACSISGEMLISIAGRVARAFFAESRGVYSPEWSIEEVAAKIDAIRDAREPFIAAGHADHMRYSFEMAAAGRAATEPAR
jgi:NAD(P)-dependent dehydrogenase (short-subunit alcohol dehydrogenase family)